MKTTFFSLLFILFLSACGYDDEEFAGAEESNGEFQTRLANNVMIEGRRCVGGERTGVPGDDEICERNQWLIAIDAAGTCEFGECPSVARENFIAELRDTNLGDGGYNYYQIVPLTPVNPEDLRVINEVWVRTRSTGETDVITRNPPEPTTPTDPNDPNPPIDPNIPTIPGVPPGEPIPPAFPEERVSE